MSCSNCDETAKAKGGVRFNRSGNRMILEFVLPSSWAYRECAILCRTCAMSSSYKPKLRPTVTEPSLSDGVLAKSTAMASSLGRLDGEPNNIINKKPVDPSRLTSTGRVSHKKLTPEQKAANAAARAERRDQKRDQRREQRALLRKKESN